jgi:hypothetical protein
MGRWVKIPWVEGQNTTNRGLNIHCTMDRWLDISLVRGQNTMGRGSDISWIEDIYGILDPLSMVP